MGKINYKNISQQISLESLLYECGASNIEDKDDYILFSSPFREDKNPSSVVYKDTLVTIDFGGDFRGSFSYFYFKCTGKNLRLRLDINSSESLDNSFFNEEVDVSINRVFNDPRTKELRIFGGEIQYDFSRNPQAQAFARRRFLSKDFREAFEIGFCTNLKIIRAPTQSFTNPKLKMTPFINRICIPVYEDYNLVSIEGRDFTNKGKPKVLYPKGGSVSHLFNHEFLDKNKPLVVVEGIMDMPRIWQYFTKNVTTTFGINMSSKQKNQLKEFDEVILFPDSDEAGMKMVSSFDDFIDKPFWVSMLKFGDPGDSNVSLKEIEYALENKLESTEFFLKESELFENDKNLDLNYFSEN